MSGSPQIRIFCGERHGSIDRAIRLLGFGSQSVTELCVDSSGASTPRPWKTLSAISTVSRPSFCFKLATSTPVASTISKR